MGSDCAQMSFVAPPDCFSLGPLLLCCARQAGAPVGMNGSRAVRLA